MRLGSPTSKTRLRLRLAPFDLVWAMVAPALALALRDPGLLDPGDSLFTVRPAYVYAFVTTATAIPAFLLFRINDGMSRFFSLHDVVSACAAVATAVGSSSVLLFMLNRLDGVPRSTPIICALVMSAGLLVARLLARILHSNEWLVDARNPPAPAQRRILLMGVDRFASIAVRLVDSQSPRTTEIVAAIDPRPSFIGRSFRGIQIVGGLEELGALIDEYAVHGVEIDEVWRNEAVVDLSPATHAHLLQTCAERGVRLAGLAESLNLTPPLMAPRLSKPRFQPERVNPYFQLKRPLDLALAFALLLFLLPIAALVAVLTLYDVGAPALFWQQRIGRNGRRFLLFKFRTYQAPFDSSGDPVPENRRLSRIGGFIRATRFDEIPQLVNVLLGHMSLVGPRPLLPQDQPRDPTLRLSVRPGITGWAQINGGAAVTPEDKDALDVWYVRNAALLLDIRILLRTFVFLFTGEKLDPEALEQAKKSRAAVAHIQNGSKRAEKAA